MRGNPKIKKGEKRRKKKKEKKQIKSQKTGEVAVFQRQPKRKNRTKNLAEYYLYSERAA